MILEYFPPLCTGFAAKGEATKDGIPHLNIGYPGQIGPPTGFNAEGLAIESNDAGSTNSYQQPCVDSFQLIHRLLSEASNLAEAESVTRDLFEKTGHCSSDLLLISSAKDKAAKVFEMAGNELGIREMNDDIIYLTNHYIDPDIREIDSVVDYARDSSVIRYIRAAQLIEPAKNQPIIADVADFKSKLTFNCGTEDDKRLCTKIGGTDVTNFQLIDSDTMWSSIDVDSVIAFLCDIRDLYTGTDQKDVSVLATDTIGSNSPIHSMVFQPETGNFWLAGGMLEGMEWKNALTNMTGNRNPYVGFNIHKLVEGKNPSQSFVDERKSHFSE